MAAISRNGIRAVRGGFGDLGFGNGEILAQDRQASGVAGRFRDGEAALKEALVGEDGEAPPRLAGRWRAMAAGS